MLRRGTETVSASKASVSTTSAGTFFEKYRGLRELRSDMTVIARVLVGGNVCTVVLPALIKSLVS